MAGNVEQVPLSFPQHLLVFLEILHPGSAFGSSFVISAAYRISGRLDEDALRGSYDDVVERHDALRSTVRRGEGIPWQHIDLPRPGGAAARADSKFTVVDLEAPADGDDGERRVEAFLDQMHTREYPADDTPLLWAFLGRLTDDDAVLVLIAHHSVADAWSMDVLIRDLAGSYRARTEGSGEPPQPSCSYADYAHAQQGGPGGIEPGAAGRDLEHWRQALDCAPVVSFPMDGERPTVPSVAKTRQRFTVPPEQAVEIGAVGRQTRTSPFITLLAAYLVVLHRLTGAEDIAVPTLTSGRGRPELDSTVGFFLNALLLRIKLGGDPTLRELLDRTRRTCLDAYNHEIPVLRLIEEVPDAGLLLADERFALLPFQHIPTSQLPEPTPFGQDSTYWPVHRSAARQDGGVAVPLDGLWTTEFDSAGGLSGTVTYSTELFDEATLRTAVDGFVAVLQQLTRNLDVPIGAINLDVQ